MKMSNLRPATIAASAFLLCFAFGNQAHAITASFLSGALCVGYSCLPFDPGYHAIAAGTASYNYSDAGGDVSVSANVTVTSSTSPTLSAHGSGDLSSGLEGIAAVSFVYYMEVGGPGGSVPIVINASGSAGGSHGLSQFFFDNDFVLYVKTTGGVTTDCVSNICTSSNSDSFNVSQNLNINTNTVYEIEMDVGGSVFGNGTQSSNGSIDPYFQFAPGFDSAGYSFGFSDGVGNAPAVAPTPLPTALPLFASGLAGLGWFARRRRKQVA